MHKTLRTRLYTLHNLDCRIPSVGRKRLDILDFINKYLLDKIGFLL